MAKMNMNSGMPMGGSRGSGAMPGNGKGPMKGLAQGAVGNGPMKTQGAPKPKMKMNPPTAQGANDRMASMANPSMKDRAPMKINEPVDFPAKKPAMKTPKTNGFGSKGTAGNGPNPRYKGGALW